MDIWKHGKFIDMWSVVHFLSGFLLCGALFQLGYNFSQALIISLVFMLLWEFYEWVTHIIEPSINVVVDILIGLAGFFLSSYFYFLREKPFNTDFFWLVLVFTLLWALWGFLDFLKRGYR